ncbi:hypothetical protein F4820DRAFT_449225 [Hypoxylon rubiginosum]|uniref:Uncharacterized protein n=1 Tax=Hypoxylon rubiginosum TaxID=110542 RepID=A0ACB9YYH7_9PEZI|nr:hypothetical protein F4820DRAFT_449225 [Hypoxylon rubiginosum]
MQMRRVPDHPDLILKKTGESGQDRQKSCCICDEAAREAIRSSDAFVNQGTNSTVFGPHASAPLLGGRRCQPLPLESAGASAFPWMVPAPATHLGLWNVPVPAPFLGGCRHGASSRPALPVASARYGDQRPPSGCPEWAADVKEITYCRTNRMKPGQFLTPLTKAFFGTHASAYDPPWGPPATTTSPWTPAPTMALAMGYGAGVPPWGLA